MSVPVQSQFAHEEYTVGWISALAIEMAAARSMLDEYYGKPSIQNPRDSNSYVLGRIGKHKIVLACLAEYGTTSAATVATSMLFSFPSLKIGLMVGIGGGIPSKDHDIRLGDVVVSKPENNFGGVVQYDLGRKYKDTFIPTGTLSKPPLVLLNAVSSLRAEYELGNGKISRLVDKIISGETMATQFRKKYSNPMSRGERDKLYKADYDHVKDESTCDLCDPNEVADRVSRQDRNPIVHYGTILSGNQVIKDAKTRDELGGQFGALCFEMEAAGLMDGFPCLVVRGICDYSDSHKNKEWQRYAALTAAAYGKELLGNISPHLVQSTQTVTEALIREPQALKVEVPQALKVDAEDELKEAKEQKPRRARARARDRGWSRIFRGISSSAEDLVFVRSPHDRRNVKIVRR